MKPGGPLGAGVTAASCVIGLGCDFFGSSGVTIATAASGAGASTRASIGGATTGSRCGGCDSWIATTGSAFEPADAGGGSAGLFTTIHVVTPVAAVARPIATIHGSFE